MSIAETNELNDMWQRIAQFRDEAALAKLDGEFWRQLFCGEKIQSIRNEIHRRYMQSLAIDAVYSR